MTDRWERVRGQERAVAQLRRAAERPVHAYLFVGGRGSGVEDAARCFAAEVVAGDDERVWDLVLRGVHPDVVEFDPPANQIRVPDAQMIIDEAYRSPIEGARKVIILFGAERLNDVAANKLLKTIEEPPPRALIVLVTAGADQLPATIRSRCARVDFAFLDGPRALGGPLAAVGVAFAAVPTSLDGTGAAVARAVESLQESIGAAVAAHEAEQQAEAARLDAELDVAGYPERIRRAQSRRLSERHTRANRRVRTDALIEGITALEAWYLDALVGSDASAPDVKSPRSTLDPRACADALDACRSGRRALLEHNPNETLMLEWLLLQLPPGSAEAGASGPTARPR